MTRQAPAAARRLVLALVACAFVTTSAAAASGYEVVMADGRVVMARTKPLIAMGKVSFLDAERGPQVFPTTAVNVAATRAGMDRIGTTARVWTGQSMARLKDGVQYVGDPEVVQESEASPQAPQPPAGTPAELLRQKIDAIDQRVRAMGSKDRQRTVLLLHQLELQQELSRLLSVPQSRS